MEYTIELIGRDIYINNEKIFTVPKYYFDVYLRIWKVPTTYRESGYFLTIMNYEYIKDPIIPEIPYYEVEIIADNLFLEKDPDEYLNYLKSQKLEELRIIKKDKIDEGFLVDGVLFDSDTNARIAYAELAMKFNMDPDFTIYWKASDNNWVIMNKELFNKVYSSGEQHIKNVFSWLKNKQEEISNANSIEILNSINLYD